MKNKLVNYFKENLFIVTIAVLLIILISIPLSALFVNIFIALNLIFTLMLLVLVLCMDVNSYFFTFPTLTLLLTIFNLAVNVSVMRLILTKGAEIDNRLIKVFSSFINGSGEVRFIMCYIIFLAVICCHVITVVKVCTRVSEVAARFTLDSFQVKLMAIEAEYESGAINEEEAFAKKEEVQKESDFLGELDGVSKIVSGNEKIRIIIIAAGIFGAVLIGVLLRGESIRDAVKLYIPLFIGNGILCMLPSFILSLTIGIVVSRCITNKGLNLFSKK